MKIVTIYQLEQLQIQTIIENIYNIYHLQYQQNQYVKILIRRRIKKLLMIQGFCIFKEINQQNFDCIGPLNQIIDLWKIDQDSIFTRVEEILNIIKFIRFRDLGQLETIKADFSFLKEIVVVELSDDAQKIERKYIKVELSDYSEEIERQYTEVELEITKHQPKNIQIQIWQELPNLQSTIVRYIFSKIYDNGEEYRGYLENNKRNGMGEMNYSNGDHYKGLWLNDLRDGEGVIKFNNGDRYEGNFELDRQMGKGAFIYRDKKVYSGQWHKNKKHGPGELILPNGDKYQCNYKRNLRHGYNQYIMNGQNYDGSFEYGKMNELDKLVDSNGNKHLQHLPLPIRIEKICKDLDEKKNKQVVDDLTLLYHQRKQLMNFARIGPLNQIIDQWKMQQSIIQVREQDSIFASVEEILNIIKFIRLGDLGQLERIKTDFSFLQDIVELSDYSQEIERQNSEVQLEIQKYLPQNIQIWQILESTILRQVNYKINDNGDKYTGCLIKDERSGMDERNGMGEMNYSNGDHYQGLWKNDLRDGEGELNFCNGDRYEGNFKLDRQMGEGTYTYCDGNVYSGRWRKNKKHGPGELILPKGDIYQCNYKKDQGKDIINVL